MLELLSQLDYHHWFIFCFLLMAMEVFIGGAFCIWVAIAAMFVGFATLFGPVVGLHLSWKGQLGFFFLFLALCMYGWRRYVNGRSPVDAYGQAFNLEVDVDAVKPEDQIKNDKHL